MTSNFGIENGGNQATTKHGTQPDRVKWYGLPYHFIL